MDPNTCWKNLSLSQLSTAAWKTLPADSYLLRKITSSLYKGLGNLSYGRSPTEEGVQSHLGLQGWDEHPGQRLQEAGHAAHPPPSCRLEPNLCCWPFVPAGPQAGRDAPAPDVTPLPAAARTQQTGGASAGTGVEPTTHSAPRLPRGRCGIFPAVPDKGSYSTAAYSMAARFKMLNSRR